MVKLPLKKQPQSAAKNQPRRLGISSTKFLVDTDKDDAAANAKAFSTIDKEPLE